MKKSQMSDTTFCRFIQYSLISDRYFWYHWIELIETFILI